MKLTDKRRVIKRIKAVRAVVAAEIEANASRNSYDHYARGLSSEGFAGGYLMALDDVEAALVHGFPSDHRGYWREAREVAPVSGNSGNFGGD